MMNAIAVAIVALAALCFWKVLDVGRPDERQWLRWLPNWRSPPTRTRWTWTGGSSTAQVRRMDLEDDR